MRIEAKPEAVTCYHGCISCEWCVICLNAWDNRSTCYGTLADLGWYATQVKKDNAIRSARYAP